MCWTNTWWTWHVHPRSVDGIHEYQLYSLHSCQASRSWTSTVVRFLFTPRQAHVHLNVPIPPHHWLKNFLKSYKENGLSPRVHKNTKRKPKHALSYASTEYMVQFLHTYAEQHALLLQAESQDTVTRTCNCYHRVCPSGKSGRCIMKLLNPLRPSMLLHTPHSACCGGLWCHQQLWWGHILIFAGNVNRTAQLLCAVPTVQRLRRCPPSLGSWAPSHSEDGEDVHVKSVRQALKTTSLLMASFPLHPRAPTHRTTQTRSKCTILLITHSRCTTRLTLFNQVRFTFWHRGSVLCSGSTVKHLDSSILHICTNVLSAKV